MGGCDGSQVSPSLSGNLQMTKGGVDNDPCDNDWSWKHWCGLKVTCKKKDLYVYSGLFTHIYYLSLSTEKT